MADWSAELRMYLPGRSSVQLMLQIKLPQTTISHGRLTLLAQILFDEGDPPDHRAISPIVNRLSRCSLRLPDLG
jgi:hypothetical protein